MLSGMRRNVFGRFERGVWVITFVGFLNGAGFSISLPFLTLYLYQNRGLSMTVVGLVILFTGLFSAGVQLLAGTLSDKFGRRPLLLGSVFVSMAMYLGIAALIGSTAPVWSIVLAYVVERAAIIAMRPAISAMITDLSPKDRLTETYGFLRVGQNVGWAAGPAIGGVLVAVLSYAWMFGVAAFISAVTLVIVAVFVRETFGGTAERTTLRGIFATAGDRFFLTFTLLSLLVLTVGGQMISTLSVFTVDRVGLSTEQYGLLLTLNGLMCVLFQYPVARALSALPKSYSLILGAFLYGIGYAAFGWVNGFGAALVAMAVVTAGEITFSPTAYAVAGELAPPDWRGRYMGFFGLSETLGVSVGPMLGGVLLDVFPALPPAIWLTIGSLAVIGAMGYAGWARAGAGGRRTV